VIDTIAGVERLYTDLVSLNEDVKVKQESLRLAERLYQDNKNHLQTLRWQVQSFTPYLCEMKVALILL